MASLVLSGDTSGSITVSAPAVAGSNTQTLVATTGTLAPIVSDTAKSATGTAVDFTGIPSWVKRVTVMLKGVSTSGTSKIRIRIGPSGGVETSGYLGAATTLATSSMATANFTAGIDLNDAQAATSVRHGAIMFSLIDSSTNTWVFNGGEGQSDTTNAGVVFGSIALSGTLTQIRITTVNGTDTFDAGTINILYE